MDLMVKQIFGSWQVFRVLHLDNPIDSFVNERAKPEEFGVFVSAFLIEANFNSTTNAFEFLKLHRLLCNIIFLLNFEYQFYQPPLTA